MYADLLLLALIDSKSEAPATMSAPTSNKLRMIARYRLKVWHEEATINSI